MTLRSKVLFGLILTVSAIAAFRFASWYRTRLTPEWFRIQIAQHLPPGSSPQLVSAFLDAHNVLHGQAEFNETGATGLPRGPALFMLASVEDSRKGDPGADGVFLVFRFAVGGGLTDFTVDYIYSSF